MQVWFSDSLRVATVTPHGDLDLTRCDELRSALLKAGMSRLVLLDASYVTFLDSSAVGVIVAAHHRLRACAGELLVVNAPRGPRRVLELLGLHSLLAATSDEIRTAEPTEPPSGSRLRRALRE
jgi:anti-anti-sigma factor